MTSSVSLAKALENFGDKQAYVQIGRYVAALTLTVDERTKAILIETGEPEHENRFNRSSEFSRIFQRDAALSELSSFLGSLQSLESYAILSSFGAGTIEEALRLLRTDEEKLRQAAKKYLDME